MNPKGGCGKSSIATNLAGYCSKFRQQVVLADLDPQQSASEWLALRPETLPTIEGVSANPLTLDLPKQRGIMLIDTPAAIADEALGSYLKLAHTILVPVLPSAIDIRAANHFIELLLEQRRVLKERVKVAVIANRIKQRTHGFTALQKYLRMLDIPYLTALRDSQNYIRAADNGLSIFELKARDAGNDWREWRPVIDWLGSRDSLPGAKI